MFAPSHSGPVSRAVRWQWLPPVRVPVVSGSLCVPVALSPLAVGAAVVVSMGVTTAAASAVLGFGVLITFRSRAVLLIGHLQTVKAMDARGAADERDIYL